MFNLLGDNVHIPPDFKANNIKIAASFLIGISAIGLGVSGTVPEKGALKATALLTGAGFMGLCCYSALQSSWEAKNWEAQREVRHEMIVQASLIEAETALELHKVITEENAVRAVAGTVQPQLSASVAAPVQTVQAQTVSPVAAPLEGIAAIQNQSVQPAPASPVSEPVTTPVSVVPSPVVNTSGSVSPVTVVSDRIVPPTTIPDGATMIEPSALNDVNKYPVMMVVAEQGSGKSVTIASIFEYLSGNKVLATPKIQDHENQELAKTYDLRFGYDTENNTGRWIGHIDSFNSLEECDLSWYLANCPQGSHYLDFVWATNRESHNRQQYGMDADAPYWRVFGDEWSDVYTNGFLDPNLKKKVIDQAKMYVEVCIKSAFFNFRGQRVQLFVGCQSETVDSIGAKGISAARNVAWHLYPGKAAIEAAKKYGKHNLSVWLANRVKIGFGVALLEKNGVFFEVINLPTLDYMRKFDPK